MDDPLFTIESEDPPTVQQAEEAPYGYKADGTPYKRRPSGPRGSRKSTGKTSTKVNAAKAVDEAVGYLWGFISLILSTLARIFKSTPLMADAIVVSKATPKVVPPLSKVVASNEQLVEMCVRLTKITPAVEVMAALAPLIGQIATNHDLVPGAENQSEAIVRAYQEELAREAERARAAEASDKDWA